MLLLSEWILFSLLTVLREFSATEAEIRDARAALSSSPISDQWEKSLHLPTQQVLKIPQEDPDQRQRVDILPEDESTHSANLLDKSKRAKNGVQAFSQFYQSGKPTRGWWSSWGTRINPARRSFFVPRLGKRMDEEAIPVSEDGEEVSDEEIMRRLLSDDLISDSDHSSQVEANDGILGDRDTRGYSFAPRLGKKSHFSFAPRLGKRTFSFYPRLGKRALVAFYPRLGKKAESEKTFSFASRMGNKAFSFAPRLG